MKLEYTKPTIEIEEFETEDIITLSDPSVLDQYDSTYEDWFSDN